MNANKMKTRFIYTILSAATALTLVFTGCTNSLTQKADRKNDSSAIVVNGSIKLPSAIPSAVRSAYTSYTDYHNSDTNSNGSLIMELYATATIEGVSQTIDETIQNGSFTITLPKEDAEWTFEVKCYDGSKTKVVMSSSITKTVQASDNYILLDPFILTYTPDTIGNGTIALQFKASDSSISQLKFELKDGDTNVFSTPQYRDFSDSLACLDIASDIPVPQGTYDLYISFIDTDGMLYGPVVETISVVTNFTTDTWFGSDSFIKQTTNEHGAPITAFVVPSATELKALFPVYTYGREVTGDVALMWNYNTETLKPAYTVHPVNSGIVSDTGYPLALGVDISDVSVDFSNNDMYVLSRENAIYKYTASSGYSDVKINKEDDYLILAACANDGNAYVLCLDPYQQMNPDQRYLLYKFDDTDAYMTEIGYVPLTYADQNTKTFKMSLCDNYLFIAYNYEYDDQEEGFYCSAFKITQTSVQAAWFEGTPFQLYYNSIDEGFNNKYFSLNDIIAVYSGNESDVNARKLSDYDVYTLLGHLELVANDPSRFIYQDKGGSWGSIVKIKTTEKGDNNYQPSLDTTTFGYRYLYKFTDLDMSSQTVNGYPYVSDIYKTTDYNQEKHLYNPVKIVGKSGTKLIIADDGAIINDTFQGKDSIWLLTGVENVDRLVTIDFTASADTAFTKQNVTASFDYSAGNASYKNYKKLAASGQQMTSGDYFTGVDGSSPNVGPVGNVEIQLVDSSLDPTNSLPARKSEFVYIQTTPTIPNATYNAVLYCDGNNINNENYYVLDSKTGAIRFLKALPYMGHEYKLAVDVIYEAVFDGKTTTIHYDAILGVCPVLEFSLFNTTLSKLKTVQDIIDLLDDCLISDYAVFHIKANKNIKPTESEFINTVTMYFNEHPCECLTLDYSGTTGLETVTAGMFGVDCSCLKLPVKSATSTVVVNTIESGAFSNNGVVFKGDLVLHKSLQSIEPGAFEVPPRSITIDKTGYTNSNSNSSNLQGKIEMASVTSNNWGEDILIQKNTNDWAKVVVCVKRDEPFEVEFKTKWKTITEIYPNAFKGLPVISKDLDVNGNNQTITIGENAFADTPAGN